MADYPDGSRLVQLIGSDIKVPIDVQGQYITLDINILSTTADIDVNINASTIELDIDITAQHIGVYLQPEWAAKEGEDKNFSCTGTNKTWGQAASVNYVVPASTTLFICGMSGGIKPATSTDYDHFMRLQLRLKNTTDGVYLAYLGGESGAGIPFTKPLTLATGKTMTFEVYSYSNLTCDLVGTCWGFEI